MNEYEVVICSHPKDFTKLPYVVKHAAINLIPKPNKFNLIVPDDAVDKIPEIDSNGIEVKIYTDSQVLDHDRGQIKFRKNWIFQQFLTLFNDVTDTDYYFDIKSDAIFLRPVQLFNKNNQPRFIVSRSEGYKEYYWNYSKKMLGLDQQLGDFSFICDAMMFSKEQIKNMLEYSGCDSVGSFLNKSIEIIDASTRISEYELYGNFNYKEYPDKYRIKKVKRLILGLEDQEWPVDQIELLIERNKEEYDMIALNSWTTEHKRKNK